MTSDEPTDIANMPTDEFQRRTLVETLIESGALNEAYEDDVLSTLAWHDGVTRTRALNEAVGALRTAQRNTRMSAWRGGLQLGISYVQALSPGTAPKDS